ncbi:MAG: DNA polymerase domain-containing protein [Nanobdellota archaeon]
MEFIVNISKIEIDKKENLNAHIYCRTSKGKKICLKDNAAYDYFFIDIGDDRKKVDEILEDFDNYRKEESKGIIFEHERQLLKIKSNNTMVINDMQKRLEEKDIQLYETDIPYKTKYVMENNIKYDSQYLAKCEEEIKCSNLDGLYLVEKLKELPQNDVIINDKVMHFDIETYDDGNGVDYENNPIIMISIICNNFKKVLVGKTYDSGLDYVETLEGEEDMLRRFIEIIKELKPDIISGYNIKQFDIPYVLKRCDKYKVNADIGTNNSFIEEINNKGKYFARGISFVDVFSMIRYVFRYAISGAESFSLDDVSNNLIGENKIDTNLNELSDMWIKGFKKDRMDNFASYCLRDSELSHRLMDYFKEDIEEFKNMLNIDVEMLSTFSFSQVVEQYLINNTREMNQIIPLKPNYEDVKERRKRNLKGAFVFEPKPGFYENIEVFDFTSLYPTIIESHNISPGTIMNNKKGDCWKVDDLKLYIKKEPKAFIPSLIKDIISRRIRLKDFLKKEKDEREIKILRARIQTLKIVANSLYGYLAFYMARWYSFEAAESVTALGRYYIKDVISTFDNKGLKVIYSDTDSVFVSLEKGSANKSKTVAKKINEKLPGLMSLEHDNSYKRGIFLELKADVKGAKKRYALIDRQNKIKIVGLAYVRSDWSPVSREIQYNVLKIILEKVDFDKAYEYVEKEMKNLNKRDVNDFIILTKLKKPINEYNSKGPHVVVAEKMKKKGFYVRTGDFISYVVKKKDSKKISDKAEIPEDVCIEEVDFEYYINNQIIPVIEGIFKVFGKDINKIVNKENNSNLSKFF